MADDVERAWLQVVETSALDDAQRRTVEAWLSGESSPALEDKVSRVLILCDWQPRALFRLLFAELAERQAQLDFEKKWWRARAREQRLTIARGIASIRRGRFSFHPRHVRPLRRTRVRTRTRARSASGCRSPGRPSANDPDPEPDLALLALFGGEA